MIGKPPMSRLKPALTVLCLLLFAACGQDPDPGTRDANRSDNRAGDVTRNDRKTGFAGLDESVEGYVQARAGNSLSFPKDHGSHPDFRIEWWYLTANLVDVNGVPLGLQWTLFRQAQHPNLPSSSLSSANPWATDQLWMAHMALSRNDTHRIAERFARGTAAPRTDIKRQAGVATQPFRAWLDDWRLESLTTNPADDPLDNLNLTAHAQDADGTFGYQVKLKARGPLVHHGINGFSQKSADGQGSMYYSQPFYEVTGKVYFDDTPVEVTGRAWLDREWSSQLLSSNQTGWDWFSLHLDSGAKLMAFRLRGGGAKNRDYFSGSWITRDGTVTPLATNALTITPLAESQVDGHQVPVRWRLALPDLDLDLEVTARNAKRWMATSVPYWEGAVQVSDARSGKACGEGYLEMTGY